MASTGVEVLSAELNKLKVQGHTAVSLDALVPYVEGLIQASRASDPEADRQRIKLNFERQLEQYKAEQESRREMFKAVIEAGQSALKALSALNGAAAVAILAFLGNVLSKPTIQAMATVPAMSRAMVFFTVGVGLVGVGFAARYFSQATYGGDFWREPEARLKWGGRFRNMAIAGAILSLIAFFFGVAFAFKAVSGFAA